MKYDGAVGDRNAPATRALHALLGFNQGERILVAGSTQGNEESIVLEAFTVLHRRRPELRLIIVPRHPERFAEVKEILSRNPLPFALRSAVREPLHASRPITLVDTMGELNAIWGLADYGFVGGTLGCGRGGQSMIEPAGYGVPTCFGPETWNFKDTVNKLLGADAAIRLSTPGQLLTVLTTWLDEPDRATALGDNAKRFIASQQGATSKTLDALMKLLEAERGALRCA
jgi:3-deoxy-D-manno-octulosonic-acid transferase